MGHEVRIDPLTGLRTLIAPDRAHRPGAFAPLEPAGAVATTGDPFAPGHEALTPPEVDADRPDGSAPDTPGWRVRVVPNAFPVLGGAPDVAEPEPHARRDLFTRTAGRGAHEVVVNAPDGVTSLGDLGPRQVAAAMAVWQRRLRHHRDAGAAAVHLWVNERVEGGASLPHTHAQLVALDFVPAQLARERERFGAHATRTMGGDLLQDLVQEEVKLRERLVAVDDEAVLLSPFAARGPFALTLVPRTPRAAFEDDGPTGAALLHEALQRLRKVLGALPPLSLWVRTAPAGTERFCWRIDLLPRLTPLAGLELGTGLAVNVVTPEDAAARLRAAL